MAPQAAFDQMKAVKGNEAFLRWAAGFDAAIKALKQELQDVQSRKLTEKQSDERSRTVYAPMFRRLLNDLADVYLAPSGPRQALFKEMKRMTELILESLEMESVYREGSDKSQNLPIRSAWQPSRPKSSKFRCVPSISSRRQNQSRSVE